MTVGLQLALFAVTYRSALTVFWLSGSLVMQLAAVVCQFVVL
jgi:hypothetical protein